MSANTVRGISNQPQTIAEVSSLLVTWQNPATRHRYLLGALRFSEDMYRFNYYQHVNQDSGFRLIPGFSDLKKHYESTVLFPLFSSQLMSAKRLDRPKWLASFGLDETSSDLLVLSRSLGRRLADNFELLAEPEVDLTHRQITALAPIHGLRYHKDGQDYVRAGKLAPGDEMIIQHESKNSADPRALLVSTTSNIALGYIPRPLLDYVEGIGMPAERISASVTYVNPERAEIHQQIQLRAVWHL